MSQGKNDMHKWLDLGLYSTSEQNGKTKKLKLKLKTIIPRLKRKGNTNMTTSVVPRMLCPSTYFLFLYLGVYEDLHSVEIQGAQKKIV